MDESDQTDIFLNFEILFEGKHSLQVECVCAVDYSKAEKPIVEPEKDKQDGSMHPSVSLQHSEKSLIYRCSFHKTHLFWVLNPDNSI